MAIELGDGIMRIGGDFGPMSAGLAKATRAVGVAATAMGAAIVGGLGMAVKEFAEQERVEAQLEAVIKSTGMAAGLTAEEVKKMASGFEKLTTYEGDAIIAGQNILLTFKNIGSDTFPRVTEAMLDVSTAMGTDLKGSAIQLGKALNDPATGLTMLTRVGITFTESQKEQIITLQESGDLLGAQTIILKELESQFGGSAQAAAATFGGQLQQLQNELKNLLEVIGAAIVPALRNMIEVVRPVITSIVAWVEANPRLTTTIVTVTGAIGALMCVLGPFLIMLPGLVALFGGGAGGGLVGATAAAAGALGGFSLAALAVPAAIAVAVASIGALIAAWWSLRKARDEERKSNEQSIESMGRLEKGLRDQGVALDDEVLKLMTAEERRQYLITKHGEHQDALEATRDEQNKATDSTNKLTGVVNQQMGAINSDMRAVYGLADAYGTLAQKAEWAKMAMQFEGGGAGGGAVPSIAHGVKNFGGGIARVHRNETLVLPKGTDVIPAGQSVPGAGLIINGPLISMPNAQIRDKSDADYFVREFHTRLMSSLGQRGLNLATMGA